METAKPTKMTSALNFGAVLGLILAILSLMTYLLTLYENSAIGWISNGVFIVGVVIAIKRRRDVELEGAISYSNGLGYGTLVALFSGIIVSFVTYIYLGFVDDSFLQFTLDNQEKVFYESGMSSEDVDSMMKNVSMYMNPAAISLIAFFGHVFFGFVVSLIASAFLKKENVNFDESI